MANRQDVFKAKVLESHYERLYGTADLSDTPSSSGDSDPDTGSPTRPRPTGTDSKSIPESKLSIQDEEDGLLSLHKQNKAFFVRQLKRAGRHRDKVRQLPRVVSSKRLHADLTMTEDSTMKKFAEDLDTVSRVEPDSTRGPRTVSKKEKNLRRKEKKRLARAKKLDPVLERQDQSSKVNLTN